METQQRYVLGERDEEGFYPVTVDQIPAGTVHRRHGSWYATMPGHPVQRAADRYQAAAHLVALIDQGSRPTVPAAAPPTPASLIQGLRATRSYSHLMPQLRLSLANLVRAAETMARLAELGWKPLEGYPGADQPWLMECRLCGWKGRRFWSHLRGRNGDGIPRPITRHPGCKPVSEHAQALSDLAALRTSTCPCPPFPRDKHPMDVDACLDVLASIQTALDGQAHMSAAVYARSILEPCPAATRRATALRAAYERHVKAQRDLTAGKRK
ncbi:hypothetical protein ABZ499_31995 [Streptomyces sp. NPDC019990]|uniref:hypothetical protein n=1 Tax=Streptomyces sp. NPDC019990 TaxID=3154693 RepID=UPI0034088E02